MFFCLKNYIINDTFMYFHYHINSIILLHYFTYKALILKHILSKNLNKNERGCKYNNRNRFRIIINLERNK
jgi:hypothetical protein